MIDFEYKTSIHITKRSKRQRVLENSVQINTLSPLAVSNRITTIFNKYNIHAAEEPVDKWWKYNNSGQGEGSALRIYPPKCAGLCSCRKIKKMKKKYKR